MYLVFVGSDEDNDDEKKVSLVLRFICEESLKGGF